MTKSWKHVLPHREHLPNPNRIASILQEYDFVGLQEVDAGSLRSGFIDQTEHLADQARFPYWYKQVNRNLGRVARHSNRVLSRVRPFEITEYKLPGFPGRGGGWLWSWKPPTSPSWPSVSFTWPSDGGPAASSIYSGIGRHYPYVIVMGDFNCGDSHALKDLVAHTASTGSTASSRPFPAGIRGATWITSSLPRACASSG